MLVCAHKLLLSNDELLLLHGRLSFESEYGKNFEISSADISFTYSSISGDVKVMVKEMD